MGISKAYAHQIVGAYREQYGLHLSCGILFNHEKSAPSARFCVAEDRPRRGGGFAGPLPKRGNWTNAASLFCPTAKLYLGDIHVRRDFGFAGDVVEAMHLITQADVPSDFAVGTGHAHSIAEFC